MTAKELLEEAAALAYLSLTQLEELMKRLQKNLCN